MNKGFTLLETILAVSIFLIAMPAILSLALNSVQAYQTIESKIRYEETAGLIFLELEDQITGAKAIKISTSSLGVDNGKIIFTNDDSNIITIDRPATTLTLANGDTTVDRLRFQSGSSTPIWLSDANIEVASWKIEPVRDATNTLTGLRFYIKLQQINPSFGTQPFSYETTTTLALQGQTIEQ
jgi:type II secretory pathway pseudopilin PulG